MRMQIILDSSFARPGSAPIWREKKGEFRDWTNKPHKLFLKLSSIARQMLIFLKENGESPFYFTNSMKTISSITEKNWQKSMATFLAN